MVSRPWNFHVGKMIWKFHDIPWVLTMVISWNIHGVTMDLTSCFPRRTYGAQTIEFEVGKKPENFRETARILHGVNMIDTIDFISWFSFRKKIHGIFISFCPREISMVCMPWIFHGIIMVTTHGISWNFHIILPTWNFHGFHTMDIPWNYHGQNPWDVMEFSYHFAHVKIPWSGHHEYSMGNRGFDAWIFHGITMVGPHGLPWNFHGV